MFKTTEYKQEADGTWLAVERESRPRNKRIMVRMDPVEEVTAGGIIKPERAMVPTEEGEVVAVDAGSEYAVGDRVVLSTAGGVKTRDLTDSKRVIRTVPEETVIISFKVTVRPVTQEELKKLGDAAGEARAKADLAAERAKMAAASFGNGKEVAETKI